ncbi:MAG: NAD-dependent epimerase/dehydratase family protein [Ignavibacteriales bacterium]
MKVLVTGAAGSVGRHLVRSFLLRGWDVRALDSDVDGLARLTRPPGAGGTLDLVPARVEDRAAVHDAVAGADLVCHLAWSFSDDPAVLLDVDLKGHVCLLEAMRQTGAGHLMYASSAVVYGAPEKTPVTEGHCLRVESARKPFYAAAKIMAENLNLAYWRQHGLPITNIRFWWAFGDDIGGRHLREMAATAASGIPLEAVAGAGGSFLHLDDLAHLVSLAALNPPAYGRTFNASSLFVTWTEIAGDISEATTLNPGIRVVPEREWRGSPFMLGRWDLSTEFARDVLGFAPTLGEGPARAALSAAIRNLAASVAQERGA